MKHAIERITASNDAYRRVIETTPNTQLVLMSLLPGEEIGLETHKGTTQFIRVEAGMGSATIGGKNFRLNDGDAIIVPPGVAHNVKASRIGNGLKLYTLYSPPHHKPGTVELTKAD